MINDVTALRGDKNMAKVITKHKCKVIIMYSKDKTARTKINNKTYKDVIKTIGNFLQKRIKYAQKHGINKSQIIIDPGMGQFISAMPRYSIEIIARLKELKTMKLNVLIGVSRKSFLKGKIKDRLKMALPLTAIAYLNGAGIIRTHDVKATKDYLNSLNNVKSTNK